MIPLYNNIDLIVVEVVEEGKKGCNINEYFSSEILVTR